MEELVNQLAELQAEMAQISDAISKDRIIDEYTAKITELNKQLSEHRDALYDLISAYGQDLLEERINEMKDQIIDEWSGDPKTMHFDTGTLKFRINKSLEIRNGGRLLEHIIEKTTPEEALNKYLKGFLLVPTRAYVDVHQLGEGIAKIHSETSVSFSPPKSVKG